MIIFFQKYILKTMFRYKKDLSRRVLSEYMWNSKIGSEKSMDHCMPLCDFVILAVLYIFNSVVHLFLYFWECHSIELEKWHIWSKFDVVAGLASWENYAPKRYCIGKKVIFCPWITLFFSDPIFFRCKTFRFVKNSKFWVK
jgi:hypothetical protein